MFKELTEEEVFQVIQDNIALFQRAMDLYGFVVIKRTSGNHRLDVNLEIHFEYEEEPVILTTRSNDYGWNLMDLVQKALRQSGIHYETEPYAERGLRPD